MDTMPADHERIARDSVREVDRRGTQVLLGAPRELLVWRGGDRSICPHHRPSWRGDSASGWQQISIRLDRRSGAPVLEDHDFVQIAQFLPQARRPFSSSDGANDPSAGFPAPLILIHHPQLQAVTDFLALHRAAYLQHLASSTGAPAGGAAGTVADEGGVSLLQFHAENNRCGNAGAAAIVKALIELRRRNVATPTTIFLFKNRIGDEGARCVADLITSTSLPGLVAACPQPCTLNPRTSTLNPQTSNVIPRTSTFKPHPLTFNLHSPPSTLDP